MTKKIDTIGIVVDVFNTVMDVQDIYLKKGPYRDLTMSETHVLDAVAKESSPSMSAVANRLNITLGTLTTAVKKIIDKGYLRKEQSTQDQRIYYLRLTSSGKEALQVHKQFHKTLDQMCKNYIPDEQLDWVYSTLKKINADMIVYRDELLKK
ncbi:MarR family transcriptional regulator [[Clostridium] spiroforme]|nr:MarR family transcriptional regulator [Thomasclavelia spiroformis]MBM6880108.1 MarR family transcriptional regulator [Thomasclavelia spiroformis]MBM6931527.1 MarR family transcriptional regulator [Thomasclavelia spiroformis]